ncbi:hypothetical protein H4R33_004849 [Dimargaris cristalligena]|uniref:Transmembrane protein 188 n=1 Tax=Dimargaris cristalligena TaxID=215637 RepID=A0A4P9ZLC9_9FUNG|nr:hypothetical protein H4R33_004849 [Dimargaris cristalligena]RKP33898.1 hypothetical protein BJ085DRAFT_34654 [Dimargaris cristalligena]|eukprot:RKP33898.1 hypothetical protein BJ085DRAFT_34654 [Dimargaris cristalligena]
MSRQRSYSRSLLEELQKPPALPQPNAHLYKDMLIFEERLKQNVRRLKRKKRKYRFQLGGLLLVILYFTWMILFESERKPWTFLYKYGAIICIIIFYWTYRSRKYTQTTKYVPQCNRSLLAFNMRLRLDRDHPDGKLRFSERIPAVIDDGFQAFKALYFQRKRSMSLAAQKQPLPRPAST